MMSQCSELILLSPPKHMPKLIGNVPSLPLYECPKPSIKFTTQSNSASPASFPVYSKVAAPSMAEASNKVEAANVEAPLAFVVLADGEDELPLFVDPAEVWLPALEPVFEAVEPEAVAVPDKRLAGSLTPAQERLYNG